MEKASEHKSRTEQRRKKRFFRFIGGELSPCSCFPFMFSQNNFILLLLHDCQWLFYRLPGCFLQSRALFCVLEGICSDDLWHGLLATLNPFVKLSDAFICRENANYCLLALPWNNERLFRLVSFFGVVVGWNNVNVIPTKLLHSTIAHVGLKVIWNFLPVHLHSTPAVGEAIPHVATWQ